MIVCAVSAFLVAPRSARADETTEKQAYSLFERGEAAYESGRFDEAIALLSESYKLKPEPVLLYNLGRAYEGIGDLAAAARHYEQFIAANPTTPDRGALEHRIATLRRQLAEREALRRAERTERNRPPPDVPTRARPSVFPWIVAGVGVASLGTGGVLGLMARNKHDDAVSTPTYIEAERLQSDASSLATTANVFLIAGGVVLALGVVWGVLDVSSSRR